MNMNTILSKSFDYQTTKNPLSHCVTIKNKNKSKKKKKKKAVKTDIIHNYVPEEAMKPWV